MTDPITEAVARAFTAAHGTPQEDARELAEVAIRALYGALEREGPSEAQVEAVGGAILRGINEMAPTRSIARAAIKAWLRAASNPPGGEHA